MLRVPGMWYDDARLAEQCWSCSLERLFVVPSRVLWRTFLFVETIKLAHLQ